MSPNHDPLLFKQSRNNTAMPTFTHTGYIKQKIWKVLENKGITAQMFEGMPREMQQNLLASAKAEYYTSTRGSYDEEFYRDDTPLSIYIKDKSIATHAFTRKKNVQVTVEHFVGEALKILGDLSDEMNEKGKVLMNYTFFFLSDNYDMTGLSIPREKIAKLGVDAAIEILLTSKSELADELYGHGSGFDTLNLLKNWSLNTAYFMVSSRNKVPDGVTDYVPEVYAKDKTLKSNEEGTKPSKNIDARFVSRKLDTDKIIRYIGFDFETVIHRSFSYAMPYAYSAIVHDSNGKPLRTYTKISHDEDEVRSHLCRTLRKERPESEEEMVYLIGYNNSRFDNFMLHQSVAQYGLKYGDPFIVKGAILGMTVEDIKVVDLLRFVMKPLKEACKDYGCEIGKGELVHSEYQNKYYDGDEVFKEYLKKKKPDIKKYVERDVASMMELWFKCSKTYLQITNLHMEDFMTLAGIGYEYYKTLVPKEIWNRRPIIDEELDEYIRGAVCGGRSQVFTPYTHCKEDVVLIDVNSQYSDGMANQKYPLDQAFRTKKYIPGKIGIYTVTIYKQPKPRIVAYKGVGNDWDYSKVFTRKISHVSVELLREFGARFKVREGVYWDDEEDVFSYYVTDLYKIKEEQDKYKKIYDKLMEEGKTDEAEKVPYNASLRNIVKLLLNSLSGKMVEKTHTTKSALIQTDAQYKRFLREVKYETITAMSNDSKSMKYVTAELKDERVRRHIPTIWGILIYEYTRAKMYREFYSSMEGMIATETDSVLVYKKGFKKHLKKFPHRYGSGLGLMSVDYLNRSVGAEMVVKKCMALYDKKLLEKYREMKFKTNFPTKYRDEKHEKEVREEREAVFDEKRKLMDELMLKHTFKGVNQTRDKVVTEKEKEMLNTEEKQYRFYWDKLQGRYIDIDTFSDMVDKKPLIVLCSQLTRVLKPNDKRPAPIAHIKQVLRFKNIPDLKTQEKHNAAKDESLSESDSDEAEESDAPVYERDERDENALPSDVDWGVDYVDDYAPVQEREMDDYKYPVFDDGDDYPSGDECSVDIPTHADVEDYSDYDSDYQEKMPEWM